MDSARRVQPIVDIVIPAYDEQASIGRMLAALNDQLAVLPYRFEILVVDDGSRDRTAEVAASAAIGYPLRVIRLTRNFGKENALLAGLDETRGEATILMDADAQHPTELVREFLRRWEQGYECVYAVQQRRDSESRLRRWGTALFYAALNCGAEFEIPPHAGDFRLLDRVAVRALCSIRERVRFTKGLYAWLGFRHVGVPYVAAQRAAGRSKFGHGKLLRLAWDGLTSFSDLPLRGCGAVGGVIALGALVYGAYIALRTLALGVDVPGWATLTDAILFLGGLQILLLGVVGQYVRNVFIETKHRPNYLVREILDRTSVGRSSVADSGRDVAPGGTEQRALAAARAVEAA
jgi:glycosyltransferase involved in cell wall biosynthesis